MCISPFSFGERHEDVNMSTVTVDVCLNLALFQNGFEWNWQARQQSDINQCQPARTDHFLPTSDVWDSYGNLCNLWTLKNYIFMGSRNINFFLPRAYDFVTWVQWADPSGYYIKYGRWRTLRVRRTCAFHIFHIIGGKVSQITFMASGFIKTIRFDDFVKKVLKSMVTTVEGEESDTAKCI